LSRQQAALSKSVLKTKENHNALPKSARHGCISADWSHPFADPDAAARQPSPAPNGGDFDVTLSGPQQRILNSLATWKQIGEAPPSNAQVAWLAGNSPSSSSYANREVL